MTVTPKNKPAVEPEWPENFTLGDWIIKAFKGRFIESLDHKILRHLRGEL